MRLNTHYIFSAGLISLILTLLDKITFFDILVISFFVSFVGNNLIDRIGHEWVMSKYGDIPRRTPLTHTIPRSIIWGLLTVMPFILLIFLFHYGYLKIPFQYNFMKFVLPLILAGIIVGPSHMFLDIFTEAGIYIKKNGKWQRVAFAHLRFNDPLGNGLAMIVGLLMLFLALNFAHLSLF